MTEALAAEAATEAPEQENDEEQVELCRFFGRRWEQYLNLPSDVSRCRSVLDLAQVQSTFLTKWLLTMASRAGGFCKPTKSYLQIG